MGKIGIVREFWDFLKHEKKWWLIPLVVVLAGVGLVLIIGGNPALAPFIYPLF
ncbi:MAG: hypothetical protein HY722_07835 [Planctomycetes bacterium]|nr:hypothetical protein [Planctomycetota bacterium]